MWSFRWRGREETPRDPRIRADIGLPPVISSHAALISALGLGRRR